MSTSCAVIVKCHVIGGSDGVFFFASFFSDAVELNEYGANKLRLKIYSAASQQTRTKPTSLNSNKKSSAEQNNH